MKAGITVKFREFINIIKEGLTGIKRNIGMSLASIVSILSVLLILAVMLIIILSFNKAVGDTKDNIDKIKVFLKDDVDKSGIEAMQKEMQKLPDINDVKFISKEEGLEKMIKEWGQEGKLLEEYRDDNPLPNSFVVTVMNIDKVKSVADSIELMPGTLEVKYFGEQIVLLLRIAGYVQLGGMALVLALIFISVFLISNTIKLSINSRRKEIEIMKYVGATNTYITGPYVIEGMILGLLGSLFAVVIVYYGYGYLYKIAKTQVDSLFNNAFINPKDIIYDLSIIFITLGLGIGSVGSIMSLKKLLKV